MYHVWESKLTEELKKTNPREIILSCDDEVKIHHQQRELLPDFLVLSGTEILSFSTSICKCIRNFRTATFACLIVDQGLKGINGEFIAKTLPQINECFQKEGKQEIPFFVLSGAPSKTAMMVFKSKSQLAEVIRKSPGESPGSTFDVPTYVEVNPKKPSEELMTFGRNISFEQVSSPMTTFQSFITEKTKEWKLRNRSSMRRTAKST